GRLGDGDAAGAADGDRLEVLAAHDRADAGTPRRPVLVVDDAGKADELLAGRPDVRDANARDAQLVADAVFGFARRLAPEPPRVADLHHVVVYEQVHRLGRLAFNEQQIVAGEL